MALNERIKKNRIAIQEKHDVPVNALGVKINPKDEGWIHAGALVLLLGLMGVLLVKDVLTIVNR